MARNILVIGATGVIGKYISNAILDARSHFDRIAVLTSAATISHKASQIDDLKSLGADILQGDLRSENDVKQAYEGIDTVVCCLGRGAINAQIHLIQWASETPSVTWFFPSEYGTDIEYNASSATEKPHQQKLKVRAYMKTVTNLDHTYVVTGPYADMYFDLIPMMPEAGGFDAKAKRACLLGDGKGKVSLTAMADVGKLVVSALQNPQSAKNATLKVNSFTTTPEEILAEFEKQTGGGKWDVSYTSLAKLKQIEEKLWQDQSPIAAVVNLRRIWTEGGTLYESRDNGLIGEPPMETLADQVKQAIGK